MTGVRVTPGATLPYAEPCSNEHVPDPSGASDIAGKMMGTPAPCLCVCGCRWTINAEQALYHPTRCRQCRRGSHRVAA